MESSERQLAIYEEWENTNNNIVINAVAGSGKTTTLIELLKRCEYKTLFLAFNRTVQVETQEKIEELGLSQGKAMTMHSLGFMAVKKEYRKVFVDKNKGFKLIKKLRERHKKYFRRMDWGDIMRMSYTLLDMSDVSRLFLIDDLEDIKEKMRSMSKTINTDDNLDILWKLFLDIREDSYRGEIITIDFNDMIYLPVKNKLHIPLDPHYLMLDECQDLNLCQHLLFDMFVSQGDISKWIAVGDINQSIYGFSGADSKSFERFADKENTVELGLDICYRCPQSVIDEANKVFDVMQYGKEAVGEVTTIEKVSDIKGNSMVICRNSQPLLGLYFALFALDVPVYLKGADILQSILKFLKPHAFSTIHGAKHNMSIEIEDLSYDKTEKGLMNYRIYKSKVDNFFLLCDNLSEKNMTVKDIITKIETLFKVRVGGVMLCTIHKSKGLEADVVYILNEGLIPSKFAKSDEDLKQEQNLKYVARTRAKKELIYLNLN